MNSFACSNSFVLSKNSSLSLTVPISIEIVSIILPFSIQASSVDPPPISIVVAFLIGLRRFIDANAPNSASFYIYNFNI